MAAQRDKDLCIAGSGQESLVEHKTLDNKDQEQKVCLSGSIVKKASQEKQEWFNSWFRKLTKIVFSEFKDSEKKQSLLQEFKEEFLTTKVLEIKDLEKAKTIKQKTLEIKGLKRDPFFTSFEVCRSDKQKMELSFFALSFMQPGLYPIALDLLQNEYGVEPNKDEQYFAPLAKRGQSYLTLTVRNFAYNFEKRSQEQKDNFQGVIFGLVQNGLLPAFCLQASKEVKEKPALLNPLNMVLPTVAIAEVASVTKDKAQPEDQVPKLQKAEFKELGFKEDNGELLIECLKEDSVFSGYFKETMLNLFKNYQPYKKELYDVLEDVIITGAADTPINMGQKVAEKEALAKKTPTMGISLRASFGSIIFGYLDPFEQYFDPKIVNKENAFSDFQERINRNLLNLIPDVSKGR